MNITISIEWLFFIVPFFLALLISTNYSNENGSFGFNSRDCFWIIAIPITLIISLTMYVIYLKFK